MNQELKQLILDICKKHTVREYSIAFSVSGEEFHIIIDMRHTANQSLEVIAFDKTVYFTRFTLNGKTALDKDITDIRSVTSALAAQT